MTRNGRMDGARALLEAGWVPVPIPPGKKGPVLRGWEQLRPAAEDLPRLFGGEGNLGVLLGEPSGGLVDVDLDCPEARALADVFLPPTGMEHGRASAPRSHRWYLCAPAPPRTVRYRAPATPEAPKGATLVELRSTGGQTVVPPSVHPSGEPVAWTPSNGTPAPRPGSPAPVPPAVLGDAVAELAAAALLARAWPAGARHDAALALAGGLARAGWEAARAVRFVLGVARAAGDDELPDRERAVRDTVAAAAQGTSVTGLPSLAKLVPPDVVSRAATWLRIGAAATEAPLLAGTTASPASPPRATKAATSTPPSLATALAAVTAAPGDAGVLRQQVLGLGHQILSGDLAEDLARQALLAAAGLPDGERVFREALEEARRLPAPIPRLSHKTPARTARAFLTHAHISLPDGGASGEEPAEEGLRLLHHYRGEFFRWRDAAYALLEEASVRADLWDFLEAGGVAPNSSRVSNAVDATRAACYLDGALDAPCWLGPPPANLPAEARPRDLVALRNGILHPASGTFVPPTPRFLTLASLPFDYDPADAAPPERWLDFLSQLWPEDPEAIETLQEMFGYLLTPDTSLQKMFLLVGPRRSGKGTIGRVLRGLLGEQNVAGPTLTSLAGNFGLAPLIGKACALVSDARLSGKLDQQVVVERLLAISGEDALTIDRKYTDAWTGQLRLRFVLLSNELPRLADASSALPGRFIILRLTQSFYGEEDPGLLERLLPELPRILHWALAGRRRLKERGYFVPPASSADLQQEMEELASPIQTFLRERCELRPEALVSCERLFFLWEQWCRGQGRDYPGTVQSFARDLRTAVPELVVERVRGDGARRKHFRGIGEAYGDA